MVKEEARLYLNLMKSELIAIDPQQSPVLLSAPELIPVQVDEAVFLGAPIGSDISVNSALSSKCCELKIMGDRLPACKRHDALSLLRHAFSIPKILFLLGTSPCFRSHKWMEFDNILRSITNEVLNVNLVSESAWLQASLPVSEGGLGIRSAAQLAPSAFLASAAGCASLSKDILPTRLHCVPSPESTEALALWNAHVAVPPPESLDDFLQKAWDSPQVSARLHHFLENVQDPASRARLLAASCKESGAWLNIPPVSSLGLRMDNDTISTYSSEPRLYSLVPPLPLYPMWCSSG